MNAHARAWGATAALAAILAITAGWWALALWPAGATTPEWVLRTREVCFGSTADRLPHAGGWILLIGQPTGMLLLLAAVWGADLRAGLTLVSSRVAGQLALGIVLATLVAGLSSVVGLVRTAGLDPFSTGAGDLAAQLTRIDNAAPAFSLTDQWGEEVTLASFRGRPVLVAFAFAHCATVCPVIVSDVLAAQRAGEPSPAVLVITLDPWRDTPSRLASIAAQWGLGDDAQVLSGAPDVVERTLNAWRVPRARNLKTGDVSHPSIVYVIGTNGRIAYVVTGNADVISAALRAL